MRKSVRNIQRSSPRKKRSASTTKRIEGDKLKMPAAMKRKTARKDKRRVDTWMTMKSLIKKKNAINLIVHRPISIMILRLRNTPRETHISHMEKNLRRRTMAKSFLAITLLMRMKIYSATMTSTMMIKRLEASITDSNKNSSISMSTML